MGIETTGVAKENVISKPTKDNAIWVLKLQE